MKIWKNSTWTFKEYLFYVYYRASWEKGIKKGK